MAEAVRLSWYEQHEAMFSGMEARWRSRKPGVSKRDYGVPDYATMLKEMRES